MDQREQPERRAGSDRPTVVVELMHVVPPAEVASIARHVARSLVMREARVRRLLEARVGPITKPLRVEKAEILRRVLEEAGVAVTLRPFRSVALSGTRAGPPRADLGPVVERSDAFVSAVLAGMVAVAVSEGAARAASLRVVGAELEAMTGTDVGAERIESLARSRGAGDLEHASKLLAALEPSLVDDQKRSILDTLVRVLAAGGWNVARARGVVQLAGSLAMHEEAEWVTREPGRVLLA